MTTVEYFGLARPRSRTPFEVAGSMFTRTWDAFRRWRRMSRAMGELRELDDRMLKDIGLSRSTLYAAARDVHGFGDRGYGIR